MMRKLLALPLFVSFAVAFAAALAAVAQEAPRAGETVEVSIVNVDVVVTDRAGNRVRGLKQEDFELRENGKVKPISNFAEYTSEAERGTVGVELAERAAAAPAAAPVRERRTLLVFFEEMQLPGSAADDFTKSLGETLRSLLAPGDQVSVVIWSGNRIHHVELTNEPAKIADATRLVNDAAKRARVDVGAVQRQESIARQEYQMDSGITGYMSMAYDEMIVRVAAINSAINSLAGIGGKKIMLLATRRLGEVAGAEFAFNEGAARVSSNLRSRFNTDALRQSIIDNANASGVTIYPLYPPGGAGGLPDGDYAGIEGGGGVAMRAAIEERVLANETASLQQIAEETGGLMAAGPKNVIDLLSHVLSDAGDYYSLAYRVTNTDTDQSRKIVVTTRNPEYKVRARTAFVEKSDDTLMRDRLRGTLFRAEQPGATIGIRAAARPSKKTSRKKPMMEVRVRIPIGNLTMLPQANGKHGGKFSIYVAAASDLHELSDVTQKTQPFEVAPSEVEQARGSHFTYDLDVEVDDRSKYLAVGVFDEVGKTYGLMRIDLKNDVKPAASPAAKPGR
jgi:VWFA-related protein